MADNIRNYKFTRKTARTKAYLAGETKYQGAPCKKHGHGGIRYVSTGECVDCIPLKNERTRQRKIRERMNNYVEQAKPFGAVCAGGEVWFDKDNFIAFCESLYRRENGTDTD